MLMHADFVCRLAEGLTQKQVKVAVIGDLTEEEAKAFVLGADAAAGTAVDAAIAANAESWRGLIHMGLVETVPAGAASMWNEIYDRCGGNIGLSEECMIEAGVQGSWEAALETVVAGPRRAVRKGFSPRKMPERDVPPLWTREQWKTVLRFIVDAEHHAVLRSALEEALHTDGDDASGEDALLSMVKYNLLTLRPASLLARDLPLRVHGKKRGEVVTLPSPAHLWAAKELKEDGDLDA